MTARIVVTDHLGPPVIGTVERDSTFLSTVFGLSNFDNTGVAAWRWTLLDRGIGSSAALSSGTSSTPQITPDISGPYFIRLQTFTDAGATILDDQDEQIISIAFPLPFDWHIPAAGETTQRGARGWATPVEHQMRQQRSAALGMALRVIRTGQVVEIPPDYELTVHDLTVEGGASLIVDAGAMLVSI